jgi:hypothetical protein
VRVITKPQWERVSMREVHGPHMAIDHAISTERNLQPYGIKLAAAAEHAADTSGGPCLCKARSAGAILA